jgi:hypothetical protein
MKTPRLAAAALLAGAAIFARAAEPIEVFLIGGQSNATGQGYVRNLPKDFAPAARVLLFHSGSPHLNCGATPYVWSPLHAASESPDRYGPELGFGTRLAGLMPAKKIALIKHAHSGTNLYAQWAPGRAPNDRAHWGPQFTIFVETVEAGLAGLRDRGFEPVLRGMIWQQGENDAEKADEHAADYGKNLAHFIARVRAQLHAPDLVFIYGAVLPPPNAQPGRDAVRAGQRDAAQGSASPLATTGAWLVATDDLDHRATDPGTRYPNDHLHFGSAGTLELGRRMAEKMAAVLTRSGRP